MSSVYGTMPMFERPSSAGGGGGGGGPGFIPPPPGASQGGEPSHYGQFPGYGRGANPSSPSIWPPQLMTTVPYTNWGTQPQTTPTESAWTYGQYRMTTPPITPPVHDPMSFGPITSTRPTFPHYSPFHGAYQGQPPPVSAPAHYPEWPHQTDPSYFAEEIYTPSRMKVLDSTATPRNSSLKRSNSQNAKKRSPQYETLHMQKSSSSGASFGHGGFKTVSNSMPVYPPYGEADVFDEKNLARRPKDWRPDWTPRQGLSSYLSKVGRGRSDTVGYNDSVKRVMHPLLLYNTSCPPLAFDLRSSFDPGNVVFPNLRAPASEMDFAQLATDPNSSFLRLYHPRLPWYVNIHPSHPSGVTVFDVIAQLCLQMLTPILTRHYYNDVLDDSDREVITNAFGERVKGRPEYVSKGVMQVDFLGDKHILEGLIKGKQGMWEMKTRRSF